MLLAQMLSKDKEAVLYVIENLTPQPLYWALFRKKVVLLGSAPVERLSEPQLLLPGETAKIQKPDIKLPWKRYIAFAQEERLLEPASDKEFAALLNIWVDEVGTVVLTEELCPDGVRVVKASSWAAWAARKKMAPAKHKFAESKEQFLHSIHAKLLVNVEPHLHASTVANVRSGPELGTDELQFLALRERVVHKAISELTGVDMSTLPYQHTPRISVAASGGGYRALVASLGSLIGLEESGLMDCITSIAGLSGSTWAMAAWYSGGQSLEETRDRLAEALSKPFYTRSLWPDIIQSHTKERVGYNQKMTLVDVMGWHLHKHLLSDLPTRPERWHKPRLSEQSFSIVDGSKPLPIYTAVCHEHKRYRWCEFTPFECGIAADLNLWTPTWGFGRRFHGGVSTDFAVEPSLALLQATWGSAFCATVDQMMHECEAPEGSEPSKLQRYMHALIYDHLDIEESRLITPAKFPNYGHGCEELGAHPWREMKTLKLMDAGVHTNLPFTPLLRRERQTDIILALDQSSAPDIYSSVSVDIAARFAQAEGLPFPDCSEALKTDPAKVGTPEAKHSAANAARCTIIRGDVSRNIPTIIYLPLLRNANFDADFCPRANAMSKNGFCSTFNFRYTAEEVRQLSGLTRANMLESVAQIRECIREVAQQTVDWRNSPAGREATAAAAAAATAAATKAAAVAAAPAAAAGASASAAPAAAPAAP